MFLDSKGKTRLIAGTLLACTLWSAQAAAQLYKCVDAAGKVTFTDRGCSSDEAGSALAIQLANSMDGSRYRQPAHQTYPPHNSIEPPKNRVRVTVVGGNNDADRQRQKLCKEASTPHKGAHGLTAAQRAHAAQLCSGINLPIPAPSASPAPATAPSAPAIITNCDSGGCWDTNGLRYNKGAGATHFPANGGPACQLINGQMICP